MSFTPAQITNMSHQQDVDPAETQEWLESLASVLANHGEERAVYLIDKLIEFSRVNGVDEPFRAETPYLNTIPFDQQAKFPGNFDLEHRVRSFVRWNAMAMVVRANYHSNVGGHIASYASAATLYEVGFNHFWHAPTKDHGGDLIYYQGHSAPGIYSRAFLMGQLSEEQILNFRREVGGKGISSYPHPWLMPSFWQFPTVSMGLGPIQAIYQARFMRYLQDRGFGQHDNRHVWCFLGDGETDEPESLGAIGMAGREHLDNLIFVINCNLQRLDGPVRGNGKIIQELEAEFRGAGWNVIKVVWGRYWDPLFARDKKGILLKRLMEVVDGEYQTYRAKDGAYIREHLFNTSELKELVADYSDEDIWNLNRGGHDPYKVFAAYHAAVHHKGQPTVILAKTVKGYTMGRSGVAQNTSHQTKKLALEDIRAFRDHFRIPVPDEMLESLPFVKFEPGSPEYQFLHEHREKLGGNLPQRRQKADEVLPVPPLTALGALLEGTAEGREISTTMAFVRLLNILVKDQNLGRRIVPIVPDESRTFGMEGMFRQLGIWSQVGQLYTPEDHDQLMFYREDKSGQILQEGINEAGAMCDWIAAATSYSTHNIQMIPFLILYSMFGFQRIGDLIWAAGDSRSRGFIMGGTSGRTTLNGEGLQHEDGHSHVWSAAVPNCVSYDPTFAYELAVIVQNGLERMVAKQEDVFYYITLMNENYAHPPMPANQEQNIIKGMYRFKEVHAGQAGHTVNLLGSGTIFLEVIEAARLLAADWSVSSVVWSCPSFTELARDGQACEHYNRLHPLEKPRVSHVEMCLSKSPGTVVAATDYVRAFAEQIRPWIRGGYRVLGTDGFGRSDVREQLRNHFEVDRYWIVLTTLTALADEGKFERERLVDVIDRYGLDSSKPFSLFA